jgi:hypothetical protein
LGRSKVWRDQCGQVRPQYRQSGGTVSNCLHASIRDRCDFKKLMACYVNSDRVFWSIKWPLSAQQEAAPPRPRERQIGESFSLEKPTHPLTCGSLTLLWALANDF